MYIYRSFIFFIIMLSACSYRADQHQYAAVPEQEEVDALPPRKMPDYSLRLPQYLNTHGEKIILVDPNVHAWGAYDSEGRLIRSGLATAGSSWCADIGRSCKTRGGSFRIYSLGSPYCKSSIYPLPNGGAPMPYCMFFNGNQGLHGSYNVVEGNVSHGCVRLRVNDAEWIRYNFARPGTKVIVKPY